MPPPQSAWMWDTWSQTQRYTQGTRGIKSQIFGTHAWEGYKETNNKTTGAQEKRFVKYAMRKGTGII